MWLLDLLLGKVLGRWMDRADLSRETKKRAQSLNPLELDDDGTTRYFTWRGRGAIMHLIGDLEPPQQLLQFDVTLCDALRREPGMDPQFNLPDQLRGEVVYEVSPDFKAKWPLLGGSAGAPGHQVLVLVQQTRRGG